MNRKQFLTKLGLVTCGALVAPFLPKKEETKYIIGADPCNSSSDWHSVYIMKRNNDTTLYIDGKKPENNKDIIIQKYTYWNRKLTDSEIKQLYIIGESSFPKSLMDYTVKYWIKA